MRLYDEEWGGGYGGLQIVRQSHVAHTFVLGSHIVVSLCLSVLILFQLFVRVYGKTAKMRRCFIESKSHVAHILVPGAHILVSACVSAPISFVRVYDKGLRM